jgi:pyrophosphatase PpaX
LKFAGLLFDLDGTVLDTTDLILQSFKHTFQVHYKREIKPQDVHAFFGKTLRAAMEFLGPDKVEELITTYREFNIAHHDDLTKNFAGMAETLQELHNAAMPMAIVTSKSSETALRGLKLFNMDQFFSVVIGANECSKHKPDPEPVQKALERLRLSPKDCLMIGDSTFDIISARAAGVQTAAVRWTYVPWEDIVQAKPDYILEKPEDLLAICDIDHQRKSHRE